MLSHCVLALGSLLLLIVLFGVDFFCASVQIVPASSASESAEFQGLPCPCIITMATQLGWKVGEILGKNATVSHSSYLRFYGFSQVTASSFVLHFWSISRALNWSSWQFSLVNCFLGRVFANLLIPSYLNSFTLQTDISLTKNFEMLCNKRCLLCSEEHQMVNVLV